MVETIIRIEPGEIPYVMIPRATAQDAGLSLQALGLLTYLLSLPANWIVRPEHLKEKWGIGRDKVHKLLKELVDKGYATPPQQYRTEDGKWDYTPYVIRPYPEIQETVSQGTDSQGTYSNKSQRKNNKMSREDFLSLTEGSDSEQREMLWKTLLAAGLVTSTDMDDWFDRPTVKHTAATKKGTHSALQDAVAISIFGIPTSEANCPFYLISPLAKWLNGGQTIIKSGEVIEGCTPVATPEEVRQFAHWLVTEKKGMEMPTKLETFSFWFVKWRHERQKPAVSSMKVL